MSKKHSFLSSRKFRHGSLAVAFVAAFAAALVLLNVAATALSERFPLTIDLTANQDYTVVLAEQHEVFVKNIQNDVRVIVCVGVDDIDGGLYSTYMKNLYWLEDATAGERYYNQMKVFLDSFHKLNSHISVIWRNPMSSSDFATLSQKYANDNIQYGDIIVESTIQTAAGTPVERYRIVKATDLYDKEDQSGYAQYGMGYYTVTGSKLESALVSAFYVVTSEESAQAVIIGGHGTGSTAALQSLLTQNNYEFTTVEDLYAEDLPANATVAVLCAPTQDFADAEIDKLEAFLSNDGKLGRNLVYIASIQQPELPHLEDFLEEWGFVFHSEAVYTETQGMFAQYPITVYAQLNAVNEVVKNVLHMDADSRFYPAPYRVMELAWEDSGTRETQTLLTSDDYAVGYPLDAEESAEWKFEEATHRGPFPLAAMTVQYDLQGNVQDYVESTVVVFSSEYFFASSDVLANTSFANGTLSLRLFNSLAGVEDAPIEIRTRTIQTATFFDKIMGSPVIDVVRWGFVVVLPLALLAVGLFVFIRRKNL